MGRAHTHGMAVKEHKGYLSFRVSSPLLQNERRPIPIPGSQTKGPVTEREVPITSDCDNQWILWLK